MRRYASQADKQTDEMKRLIAGQTNEIANLKALFYEMNNEKK